MIRRVTGLTSPTVTEDPRAVEKTTQPKGPTPKAGEITTGRSWESERSFVDRGPRPGLTWRRTDIDMPWANELHTYVERIAASAAADPELFFEGIAAAHVHQAVGFLKAMARRLGKFVSAPHGAPAEHYGEPFWVKTVYVDPGDGHRFHETWASMLSDYVRTIEYGGIDHADENLIPIGAAIAFIESQASLLETYSTAEHELAGKAISSSRAARLQNQ